MEGLSKIKVLYKQLVVKASNKGFQEQGKGSKEIRKCYR